MIDHTRQALITTTAVIHERPAPGCQCEECQPYAALDRERLLARAYPARITEDL